MPGPLSGLRGGAEAKIQRQVAYQIKGNDRCSIMVTNILPVDPRPWVWS